MGLVLLALAGACGGSVTEGATSVAHVARVVDGDTIVLDDGRRARLVQIDAPEVGSECYANAATQDLGKLLPAGARVELEADPKLDRTDRFGRLLRYVLRDDVNVNVELVRRGAASVWFYDGDRGRYADRLLEAARDARTRGAGLWRACPGTLLNPLHGVETGG